MGLELHISIAMVSNKNYRYFVTTVYLSTFDDLNRQFILLPTWLVYKMTIVFLDKYTRLLRQKFIKTNQSSDIIQKYFLNLFEKWVSATFQSSERGWSQSPQRPSNLLAWMDCLLIMIQKNKHYHPVIWPSWCLRSCSSTG